MLNSKKLHRINIDRFSSNICIVAKTYGFKTVGSMYKSLKQANPNAKWQVGIKHVRGSKLLKELEAYL